VAESAATTAAAAAADVWRQTDIRTGRQEKGPYKSGRPFYPSVSPPTPLLRAFGIE